jgi:hypothetical protein
MDWVKTDPRRHADWQGSPTISELRASLTELLTATPPAITQTAQQHPPANARAHYRSAVSVRSGLRTATPMHACRSMTHNTQFAALMRG